MTPDDARELAGAAEGQRSERAPQGRRTGTLVLGAAVLALAAGIGIEIHGRASAETELASTMREAAVPVVTIIHPSSGAPDEQLTLPGSTQAFIDTPIYARTSGYLKK